MRLLELISHLEGLHFVHGDPKVQVLEFDRDYGMFINDVEGVEYDPNYGTVLIEHG